MSRPTGRAPRCIVRSDDGMDDEERAVGCLGLLPPTGHVPEVVYVVDNGGCTYSSALSWAI